MRKLWSNIWAMHDMSGFGHMHRLVPGVQFYSDRAMLLPAQTVVVHENGTGSGLLEEYEAFLRRPEVALGPNRIIRVKGDDLFSGIMCDPFVLEDLRRAVMHGGRPQVFCMTPRAEAFFKEAMIDERKVDSAPLEIANKMNDKAWLRTQAAPQAGISHAFLDYRVETSPRRVYSAVTEFLRRRKDEMPFVVLKRTNLAGGDGFLRVTRDDDVKKVVGRYMRRHIGHRIIIEEGQPGQELSMLLNVRGRSSVRVIGWTRQIVGADGRHRGNTMTWRRGPSSPHPDVNEEDRRTMETWSRMLAEYARDRIVSYEGEIGTDQVRINRPKRDGRQFFIREVNARQTASTYPLAVSSQLEGRGEDAWNMVMLNGVRTKSRALDDLLKRLDDLTFERCKGVLPFNPRLMTLPDPHCGLIVVGKDFTETGKMLKAAKERLVA